MKQALVIVSACALAVSGFAQSESIQTLFNRDNRMPELFHPEIGALVNYKEFDEASPLTTTKPTRNETTVTPYARFGLAPNLTLYSAFPYGFIRSDTRDATEGIRDISVGMELLAYEYTYKYPWVIPYGEIKFPTGDEDKYLGNGKVDAIFGTSVGTTTYDVYHWILTGQVDSDIKGKRIFSGAAAIIWDLSDQFSLLGEGKVTEQPDDSKSSVPVYLNAGMSYRPLEWLYLNWYGGKAYNTEEDVSLSAKLAFCF